MIEFFIAIFQRATTICRDKAASFPLLLYTLHPLANRALGYAKGFRDLFVRPAVAFEF
jgi:hypothetical protein